LTHIKNTHFKLCIVENTSTALNPWALKSDNELRARTNKHFTIRWRLQGTKPWNLVGAGRLAALLQEHTPTVRKGPQATADKYCVDAWEAGQDRYRILVRETLEILFVSK